MSIFKVSERSLQVPLISASSFVSKPLPKPPQPPKISQPPQLPLVQFEEDQLDIEQPQLSSVNAQQEKIENEQRQLPAVNAEQERIQQSSDVHQFGIQHQASNNHQSEIQPIALGHHENNLQPVEVSQQQLNKEANREQKHRIEYLYSLRISEMPLARLKQFEVMIILIPVTQASLKFKDMAQKLISSRKQSLKAEQNAKRQKKQFWAGLILLILAISNKAFDQQLPTTALDWTLTIGKYLYAIFMLYLFFKKAY